MYNVVNISVVIPCFNREKTIEKCLKSILAQTLRPKEIICVDDCSTDSTVCLIEKISELNTNVDIKCVKLQTNSGAQVARNYGIMKATCDWIAFIDSDDEWDRNMLQEMSKVVLQNCRIKFVYTDGFLQFSESNNKRLEAYNLPEISDYKDILKNPAPTFSGMLVSKRALIDIGNLDEKVPSYQEWETSIRLIKNCKVVHIKKNLFYYNIHDGEAISKDKKRDIAGYDYIIRKHRNEIIKKCGEEIFIEHLLTQLNKCIYWQLPVECKKYLKEIKKYKKFYGTAIHLLLLLGLERGLLYKLVNRFMRIAQKIRRKGSFS